MYGIAAVRECVKKAAQAVMENADALGELDGKSGDGDLGLSMKAAFHAVADSVSNSSADNLGKTLLDAAMACNKAAPSTMGTLLTAGLMNAAKALNGKAELSDADVVRIPRIMAEGIMKRGKAKQGDKTILDALIPMSEAAETAFAGGANLKAAFTAAAETAAKAADNTAGMKANVGRAHWLGERAAVYPDGGAVLCAILAKSFIQD